MKPVAAQPQVGGQQCGDGTGNRSGIRSGARAIATALGVLLLVALAGCAQQRNAGTTAAAVPSPDLVQPQPGQPGAESTPLANTTPFERQPAGRATGATGADWLAALGALFAPFITPGTPSTFVGNAANALRSESDNQQQAENLPNLIYPPPEPNLVYPPATDGAVAGDVNAPSGADIVLARPPPAPADVAANTLAPPAPLPLPAEPPAVPASPPPPAVADLSAPIGDAAAVPGSGPPSAEIASNREGGARTPDVDNIAPEPPLPHLPPPPPPSALADAVPVNPPVVADLGPAGATVTTTPPPVGVILPPVPAPPLPTPPAIAKGTTNPKLSTLPPAPASPTAKTTKPPTVATPPTPPAASKSEPVPDAVVRKECTDPKTGKALTKPLHPSLKIQCPKVSPQGTVRLGSVGAGGTTNSSDDRADNDPKPNPCVVAPPKPLPPGCPSPKPPPTLTAPNVAPGTSSAAAAHEKPPASAPKSGSVGGIGGVLAGAVGGVGGGDDGGGGGGGGPVDVPNVPAEPPSLPGLP